MKTTKLFLVLVLSLVIFNGCSNEELFIKKNEEATIEETIVLEKTEESASADFKRSSKQDTKNYSSYNTANKTEDWFNQQQTENIPVQQGFITTTMLLIAEFALAEDINGFPIPLSASEKDAVRQHYAGYLGFISYTECSNSDKEIWTLNSVIYNDDTITFPGFTNHQAKNTHVGNDPILTRLDISTTSHPCFE